MGAGIAAECLMASRCVLHQGEYLALALGVDSAHCKDAPPGGGRGPLVSYLPRLSRSPAQFFHHSRHFSLALSRREADHSA